MRTLKTTTISSLITQPYYELLAAMDANRHYIEAKQTTSITSENGRDSPSSSSDPDEHNDFPPAVKAAYNLHRQYKI